MDKLIQAIYDKKNPTVVGLDPTLEMIPEYLRDEYLEKYGAAPRAVAELFARFNKDIIDQIYDVVPAVKPQIAMYEKFGQEGIRAYNETCEYAHEKGLLVIGDVKRGDISSTAAAYASHIGGAQIGTQNVKTWTEDAVTLNPYMGSDGIRPFLEVCKKEEKAVFLLVKTSNPGSAEIQDLVLADGRRVYEAVGDLVEKWGGEVMGTLGYSKAGAVVGATHKEEGEKLRKRLPHTFFLVPGYGAQGGTADDIAGFFDKNGTGAIVNSSRGITSAYKKDPEFSEREYVQAARKAALRMRDDLRRVL